MLLPAPPSPGRLSESLSELYLRTLPSVTNCLSRGQMRPHQLALSPPQRLAQRSECWWTGRGGSGSDQVQAGVRHNPSGLCPERFGGQEQGIVNLMRDSIRSAP